MANIVVVYHSGFGHTKKQAEAVYAGAKSIAGVVKASLIDTDKDLKRPEDAAWATLDSADAIIFGSPTYMGGVSAQFKAFADATSKRWATRDWQNKIAGGFTNSASLNGDKGVTLHYLMSFAMQHGMIWVGLGLLPASSSKASRNDLNRLGAFSGAMAQSDSDVDAEKAPPKGDLDTAHAYGVRIAEMALRFNGHPVRPKS